jgi:hypothetical protein
VAVEVDPQGVFQGTGPRARPNHTIPVPGLSTRLAGEAKKALIFPADV